MQTFLDLAGVDDLLEGTDLVVTGEGKLDEQTLRGKAPAGVAGRAAERGIPVVAVCGQNTLPPSTRHPFQRIVAMTDVEPDVRSCLRNPCRCWSAWPASACWPDPPRRRARSPAGRGERARGSRGGGVRP
ncbi:hypothetical protein A5N15_03235 [Rothia kristinae]|uniref:Glycerate kinase n=1 Tax=Rothia kristinae TaxID=37923 RepID=A0A657IWN1_9MICC|nr:hypothetical protein A5N15_03235 [Rothia kristinae]